MKDNWNDLSMYDRNEFIKIAVRNGLRDPKEIRDKYNEFAEGGPLGHKFEGEGEDNQFLGLTLDSWKTGADIVTDFLPIVGTAKDIYRAYQEPTWENIEWAAASLGSDLIGTTAVRGALKASKRTAKFAKEAEEAASRLSKIEKQHRIPSVQFEKYWSSKGNKKIEEVFPAWNKYHQRKQAELNALQRAKVAKKEAAAAKNAYTRIAIGSQLFDAGLNTLQRNNQKAYGGGLDLLSKPFSHRPIPKVRYNDGGYLFDDGGATQEEVEFSLLSPKTWKYKGSPIYNSDIPFANVFAKAVANGDKSFMWNDQYYDTDINWNPTFEVDKQGRPDFKKFAETMYPAVISVLKEQGLPITNAHNVVRQMARESSYGTSNLVPYNNYGGIKYNPASGRDSVINELDGLQYTKFKDLKDYINYMIGVINGNYYLDPLNASNGKEYVDRLHPKASGKTKDKNKKDYSADYKGYSSGIYNMKSLDKYLMDMYNTVMDKK